MLHPLARFSCTMAFDDGSVCGRRQWQRELNALLALFDGNQSKRTICSLRVNGVPLAIYMHTCLLTYKLGPSEKSKAHARTKSSPLGSIFPSETSVRTPFNFSTCCQMILNLPSGSCCARHGRLDCLDGKSIRFPQATNHSDQPWRWWKGRIHLRVNLILFENN